MVTVDTEYFDLHKIMDSGQCFRITPCEDGSILTVHRDRFVRARQTEDLAWEFDCSQEEFDAVWRDYFDLDRNYGEWFASVDPEDAYLQRAASLGRGLRVVNQDHWETLVCFIISQRRSVPSITTCVDKLCRRFGVQADEDVFLFPSPEALSEITCSDLDGCSMGYRNEYVLDAAKRVADGRLDLDALESASDEELLDALMEIKGVGIKVANCTALYGYQRLGLFPIDVWIDRVLKAHYPAGFPLDRYPGYSGFMQLLMFYAARH